MFYTIYKITNIVNNKIYIGKHQTENLDDGYMGSGLYLGRAINKYGIDKFVKEILYIFDNEQQMIDMEKEIVNEEFLMREDVYNLKIGGEGDFDYINENKISPMYSDSPNAFTSEERRQHCQKYGRIGQQSLRNKIKNDENFSNTYYTKVSNNMKLYFIEHDGNFKNKKHTDEAKQKIGKANAIHQHGNKNSQYGKCWIYNENLKQNKSIKKIDLQLWLDLGWIKGRKIKHK